MSNDVVNQDGIRLNKLLSSLGVCSRREADRLIGEGRVLVNGLRAQEGQKVSATDHILLDGREIDQGRSEAPVVLAFNKPRGMVCTSSKRDRAPNIIDHIGYGSHIFPIGRLDKDSEGLILLTNMGELVNRVNRGQFEHEKEYEVSLSRDIDRAFADRLEAGVLIEVPDRGRVRASCRRAEVTGRRSLRIVLTEGMNRQIRRMCGALGAGVLELRRVKVMNIRLGSLEPGSYRILKGPELEELLREAGVAWQAKDTAEKTI